MRGAAEAFSHAPRSFPHAFPPSHVSARRGFATSKKNKTKSRSEKIEKNENVKIKIDYRKLNEKIIKTRYPLLIIADQIDRLQKAAMFSTTDLRNGFFHVPLAESSRKCTSFVIPNV